MDGVFSVVFFHGNCAFRGFFLGPFRWIYIALRMCKGQSSTDFESLGRDKKRPTFLPTNWPSQLGVDAIASGIYKNHDFYKTISTNQIWGIIICIFQKRKTHQKPTKNCINQEVHPPRTDSSQRLLAVKSTKIWQKCPKQLSRSEICWVPHFPQQGALLSVTGIISGWCWIAIRK